MGPQVHPHTILAHSMESTGWQRTRLPDSALPPRGTKTYSLPTSHAQVGTRVQMEMITAFRFLWESRLPVTDVKSTNC